MDNIKFNLEGNKKALLRLYIAGEINHVDFKPTPLEEIVHKCMIARNRSIRNLRAIKAPRRLSIRDIENVSDNYQAHLEYQWEVRDLTESIKELEEIICKVINLAEKAAKHNKTDFHNWHLNFYQCWDCQKFQEIFFFDNLNQMFWEILRQSIDGENASVRLENDFDDRHVDINLIFG